MTGQTVPVRVRLSRLNEKSSPCPPPPTEGFAWVEAGRGEDVLGKGGRGSEGGAPLPE